ncbi:CheR family methyltransferase [Hydrogenophaga sp. 5NK40-0174]|uniref:CheR family methyltransferase n=1 Tax=Hydrogenophaga sp. 5NK40-0174 TaxID=3127649 RepID=UPI00310278C9
MTPLRDTTFRKIVNLMHEICGLSFPDSKKPLIASRLAPRIQRLGMEDYDEYVSLIDSPQAGGELQMAIDLLTTNETYFFREQPHFDLMERDLIERKLRNVSVWSAASSFGDEAYSIAMLLGDLQRKGTIDPHWSILGTDISDRVLRAATQAVFPEDRMREVSDERLKRYCLKGEGESEGLVQIKPTLRENVHFGRLNLTEPIEDLGPFDVVFLRNVLIYFDGPTKVEVVERVTSRLKPGGLFFIGTAEGRVKTKTRLTPLGPGAFRKEADE